MRACLRWLLLLAALQAAAADYRLETVAANLTWPWCIAFLPDGDMLVTERTGDLHVIRQGILDPRPVGGVPPAYVRSQGGLFDVLLHPDYAENRLVYLSLAHGAPDANATRVVRGRFDGTALTDVETVFTVEPTKDTPVHYGGRMLFLPDGTLLLTTGDGFVYREEAQRLNSLLGKIVRLNEDGTVPADNPFVDDLGARDEIWSYGHRNPQGIVHDPTTDTVYAHEHGAQGGDELNVIVPGNNYGWPIVTLGIDYTGARISPFREYPGMTPPVVDWTPSIAAAGMTWYDGDAFPEWRGDLFVTSLVFNYVERVDLEQGEIVGRHRMFEEIGERIRDIRTAPDGNLYVLTDSETGRVVRVAPVE